jgi:ribosomal protein S18 acetylase RimI-like enzyme
MKEIKLKSGHTLIIRSVQKDDASNMLHYLKVIGGESDNLLFGPEGVPMTLEQEEKFLESSSNNATFPMFVGLVDQNIVSVINASGSTRERVAHLAEIGISVLKAYWHQGIGRHMMTYLIDHVKKIGTVNTLHLRVRTDNINAISLYQSMGFEIIGTFHHHTRI